MINTMTIWMALESVTLTTASSQQPPRGAPPNGVPLFFGMNAAQAARVLGVPLHYIRGRSGDELFLAIPNVKGSALSSRSERTPAILLALIGAPHLNGSHRDLLKTGCWAVRR
jgi:hypothetical protein